MTKPNFLARFGAADDALRQANTTMREAEAQLKAAAQELHDFEMLLEMAATFTEQHGCQCSVDYGWRGNARVRNSWHACCGNCSRLYEMLDKYGAREKPAAVSTGAA